MHVMSTPPKGYAGKSALSRQECHRQSNLDTCQYVTIMIINRKNNRQIQLFVNHAWTHLFLEIFGKLYVYMQTKDNFQGVENCMDYINVSNSEQIKSQSQSCVESFETYQENISFQPPQKAKHICFKPYRYNNIDFGPLVPGTC